MKLHSISNKTMTLSVSEIGAAITELAYFDNLGNKVEILRGEPDAALKSHHDFNPLQCGMFPMVPFVNRIAGNCFELNGNRISLPTHHLDDTFFLHGDGWISNWDIEVSDDSIRCYLVSHIDGVCHYSACQELSLCDNVVTVKLTVKNLDKNIFPCGIGLHPYFKCEHNSLLSFNPDGVWLELENHLPGEYLDTIPEHFSFHRKKVPDYWVNNCYKFNKEVTVDIVHPEGIKVSLSSDASYMMIFRPSSKENYVCLEPQTQMLDAHNSIGYPTLKLLESNAEISISLSIKVDEI
ncbi:hypothetical protein ACE1BS_14080 [Aeromonas jandaei]